MIACYILGASVGSGDSKLLLLNQVLSTPIEVPAPPVPSSSSPSHTALTTTTGTTSTTAALTDSHDDDDDNNDETNSKSIVAPSVNPCPECSVCDACLSPDGWSCFIMSTLASGYNEAG